MKSNDPRSPDSPPSATPPPVDQADEGGGQRAPFSISDGGDFSTPHRRRRTITRPRGLKAVDSPSPDLVEPGDGGQAGGNELTPLPSDTAQAPAVEAADPSLKSAPTMSAVDEFLASPPTPVPELATPAPAPLAAQLASIRAGELASGAAASGEVGADGDFSGLDDGVAAAISREDESLDGHRTSRSEPAFLTPEPLQGATPIPEIPIDVQTDPSASLSPSTLASRSLYRPTPPPIPRDAMTPAPPAGNFEEQQLAPPDDAPELSGDAYAETTTFSEEEPAASRRSHADRDGSASSGPVPIIENASAGAEMRLAALGAADSQIDAVVDAVLDGEPRRDEAMVDDLLRRATEQMFDAPEAGSAARGEANAADGQGAGPGQDGLPIHEVEDIADPTPAPTAAPLASLASGSRAEAASEPIDAVEPIEVIDSVEPIELPAELPPLVETLTDLPVTTDLDAIGAVAESETDEPPKGQAGYSVPEPSLSPLAQTLAHMAEALHTDFGADNNIEIDIVDGPLVNAPRRATPTGAAMPPPVPGAALSAVQPGAIAGADGAAGESPMPEALADRPRLPRRSKPWYEEVFDEDYLRTLPFMTAEQTLREVDFIESSLAVSKGAQVLDLGCGYGRHAIELVQRGLTVTGLDLSLPLLIRAADEAQRRALSVNFVHSDMRGLAFDREFDGAYCMLTTFGYFDEESNLKVAEGIARALKPGGRFLLDVVNRDYIVGDLPARIWWEGEGCVVLEEVEFNFNTSRILTHRSVVFEDGRQLDHEISVRAYSLHELGKLFRQTGFRVIDVAGSIYTPSRFFGAASRNLIILAERKRD